MVAALRAPLDRRRFPHRCPTSPLAATPCCCCSHRPLLPPPPAIPCCPCPGDSTRTTPAITAAGRGGVRSVRDLCQPSLRRGGTNPVSSRAELVGGYTAGDWSRNRDSAMAERPLGPSPGSGSRSDPTAWAVHFPSSSETPSVAESVLGGVLYSCGAKPRIKSSKLTVIGVCGGGGAGNANC